MDAGGGRQAKADLHVHSKYSDRSDDWFRRRIGASDSCAEPEQIYRTARSRGMDFVTIADHDRIDGSLEIAHHPEVFISCETTACFPEDGCRVHLLVAGIDEDQFARIQASRGDIYELRALLSREGIFHAVAHPLSRADGRMTVDHVEKLLLLFRNFEVTSGGREAAAAALARAVLDNLTRERMDRLVDKHGIEPIGPEPWIKHVVGGTDDHSGLYVGSAYTMTPPAETVEEFLEHLAAGRHQPGGNHGSSLRLAHGIYHIGYRFWHERLSGSGRGGEDLVGQLFDGLTGDDGVAPEVGNEGRASGPVRMVGDRETFRTACRLLHAVGYAFTRRLEEAARNGRLEEILQALSSLAPLTVGVMPYLTSFHTRHRDDGFLQQVTRAFPLAVRQRRRDERRAWLTDTFGDLNGVSNTIHNLAAEANRRGKRLTVITSADRPTTAEDVDVENFPPVGWFHFPGHEDPLPFPPFLEILEHLERRGYSEVVVSTLGPMGLLGIMAARTLGMRAVGIHHVDLPARVRALTDDDEAVRAARSYMRWFYGQMDTVFVPSLARLRQLGREGLDPLKLHLMERGVDRLRFNPERRDPDFWMSRGLTERFVFLYVGRVSREKSIERLLQAFRLLQEGGRPVSLAVVGDGPHRAELEERYTDPQIRFTGVLDGDELSGAYASADAFVFPSTTDTFGNVVLEAQASGIPAVLSGKGGAVEAVRLKNSGLIVDEETAEALAGEMARLLDDRDLYEALRRKGLASARRCSWRQVLDDFWNVHVADAPALVPTVPGRSEVGGEDRGRRVPARFP